MIPLLAPPSFPDWMQRMRQPYHASYFSFFSSLAGGITTEPLCMQVPADDHLVHRGDGVFETLKCVRGALYLLGPHLDRLLASARAVGIPCPWPRDELADIVVQTVRAGGRPDNLVRLILARGPGSMGISPADCPTPALYVLVYEDKPPFMAAHPGGARAATSRIPVKPGLFATIKTCNYLPNALMKQEALDLGVDFTFNFDELDRLAEGATENAGLVDSAGRLRIPGPDRILAGTTMARAMELAAPLVREGLLSGLAAGTISRMDLASAREILVFGTTPQVTSVVEFENRTVADGKPGPVGRRLDALIAADQLTNPAARTEVWPTAG